MEGYNVIPKSALLLLVYLTIHLLVKFKKIKLTTKRRIWNVMLLVSFSIVGSSGLLMAVLIDRGIITEWYSSVLEIHVNLGIIMAIISITHIIERLWFFDIRNWGIKQKDPQKDL